MYKQIEKRTTGKGSKGFVTVEREQRIGKGGDRNEARGACYARKRLLLTTLFTTANHKPRISLHLEISIALFPDPCLTPLYSLCNSNVAVAVSV